MSHSDGTDTPGTDDSTSDPSSGSEGQSSSQPTTVYDLTDQCTVDDVETNRRYRATVNGVVEYGVFVDLSESLSGLVHESNLIESYDVGDQLVVELVDVRENGDLSFAEIQLSEYRTESVGPGTEATAGTVSDLVSERAYLDGQIVQIKQTGGPTIFQLRTADGVVPCAAFEEAGVRAFPEASLDDLVRVTGEVQTRNGTPQVEVTDISLLDEDRQGEVRKRLEVGERDLVDPADVDPLVRWDAFEKLRDDLEGVARQLRETILSGRPIRIRHHADGDGLCAGVPIQYALEQFIEKTWVDPEAPQRLLKRLPSKAPFYELEDVTRDLNFALQNQDRHGQKLPLFLMLDNGSTEEDTPAYRNLSHYDVPILVVDHHHPDEEAVADLVDNHVNPYLYGEDYRITTGMMSVEIGRMIAPEITEDLRHVPAVAGLADRSEGEAMPDYLELAREAGYEKTRLREVSEALDYATYWLNYNAGREFVNDVLNVNCEDRERHEAIVDLLSERAERDVTQQLETAMQHVTHEKLENGADLYRIAVERHAKRFTYPAPGKTTGKIHDEKVTETGGPTITIGFGPDFAVLRSDGVRLDIPQMVAELTEEIEGGGVSGGGHLVVGSIKFVSGMRTAVIDALVEKMSEAEIDEDLGSSIVDPEEI